MEKFKEWWAKHKVVAIVIGGLILAVLAYIFFKKKAAASSATPTEYVEPTAGAPAAPSQTGGGGGGADIGSVLASMQQGFEQMSQQNQGIAQGMQSLAQSFQDAMSHLQANTAGPGGTGSVNATPAVETTPTAEGTYSALNKYVNSVMQYASSNFAGKAVSPEYANYSSGLAAAHQSANAARTVLAQQGQAFSSTFNSPFVQNLYGQFQTASGGEKTNLANQIAEAGGGVVMQTPTGGSQLVVSTNNGLQYHGL